MGTGIRGECVCVIQRHANHPEAVYMWFKKGRSIQYAGLLVPECMYVVCLTAHNRPICVCMAPSSSRSALSVALSVKKKYILSSSLSALSGMRWAAINLGSVHAQTHT